MKFSIEMNHQFLNTASSAYLNKELPADFIDLDEEKRLNFIITNAGPGYEYSEPEDLFQLIEDHATAIEVMVTSMVGGGNINFEDKYYFVKLKIINGGFEDYPKTLVFAKSESEAIESAFEVFTRDELEYLDDEGEKAYDCGGEILITLISVDQISHFDAAVLRKYN